MRRASLAPCTALVWASFLLFGEPARAADDSRRPETRSAPATKPSAVAKADTDSKQPASASSTDPISEPERAAALAYDQALSTYAQGDTQGAFEQMRESYRLSQRPELLYNLARLERELKDCRASLEDYRRYLERMPNGRYRAAAAQASSELELECPTANSASSVVPATRLGPLAQPAAIDHGAPVPTSGDAKYWTPPRVIGWSAIASGVLAEGGMLYFWLAAKAARDDFQATVSRYDGQAPLDQTAQDRQHRDQRVAQALAVTGGALIATGALVLILGPRERKTSANARLFLQPGGIGAGYSRSF